jgi:ketosteroid isomerase-like protein
VREEESLETIRRAIDAFNRRDLDAVTAAWSADIEWHQITPFPERAVFRGPAEVREKLFEGQLFEQLEGFRVEPDELVEVGDDVIFIGHIDGRGRESGLHFRLRTVVCSSSCADGKIVWVYDCSGESRTPLNLELSK